MKKKSLKLYLVIVLILFVFVLYFSFKDNYIDIINTLKEVNIVFILIGLFFVFLSKYYFGEIIYHLAKKEKKDIKKLDAVMIELIYPFFAGITPSSLGGESFEIYYLKDCGIPIGKGSNITIQKFIVYQISLISVNILVVLLNFFLKIIPFNSFIFICVIINFIINIALLGFFFLLAYNKKFNHFIMNKCLAIGYKLHLIRNIEKTKTKVDSYLNNFDAGVENLRKDRKLFIKLIIINILSLLFFNLTAYPIAVSMGITSVNFIKMFIVSTFAKIVSLIVITPGNSGAAEYSFVYLFSTLTGLISDTRIMAFMLMWRLVTYYIPLIAGGIFAILWGRRKHIHEEVSST